MTVRRLHSSQPCLHCGQPLDVILKWLNGDPVPINKWCHRLTGSPHCYIKTKATPRSIVKAGREIDDMLTPKAISTAELANQFAAAFYPEVAKHDDHQRLSPTDEYELQRILNEWFPDKDGC